MTTLLRTFTFTLATLLITLAVPVCLTLGSVRLLMTAAYLQLEYHKPDFPPDDFGFTLADRLRYAPYAVEYLISGPDNELSALTFADGSAFYNSRELQHMADVRRVTRTALNSGLAVFIVVLALALLLGRSEPGRVALRFGLFRGAALTLLLIVGLAAGVFAAWDTLFTQFHELFFSNGTWTFAYSDSLIRLFPVRFWQDAALTIGGLVGVGALIIMLLCAVWARKTPASDRAGHAATQ